MTEVINFNPDIEVNSGLVISDQSETVFVSGNFNVIHAGHLRLLDFAKNCGKSLVVGVFADGSEGVIVPLTDRLLAIRALPFISKIFTLKENDLKLFLEKLKPTFVVKGREYENVKNIEEESLRKYGGKLIFASGETHLMSADIVRSEVMSSSSRQIRHEERYLTNNKSSRENLINLIKRFPERKVLIIGDLITDEYIYCDPLGMSQEEPTIVFSPQRALTYVGGAGVVASHLRALGADVHFFTVTGDDSAADFSRKTLEERGVKCHFVMDQTRPTTLKKRYKVGNRTVFRASYLRSHDLADEECSRIVEKIDSMLPCADYLIFSDFNYGALPQRLVNQIIDICKDRGVKFSADSQSSSQTGDVSRFKGADLVSATEKEIRLALNDFKGGLQNVANKLHDVTGANCVFAKLAADGMIVLVRQGGKQTTSSLPALNSNPIDVSGAGDAMLAAASLSRACGGSVAESAYIGAIAAAVAVSYEGNVPISSKDILGVL